MKRILVALILILVLVANVALGETYSVTTGLVTDQPYKPVVCQMDNEPGARPQKGIGSADVVYEVETYNGGYTRYTCVFNDTIPEKVEAVRSSRIVHLDVYQEWGGVFVCFGFLKSKLKARDALSYSEEVVDVLINGHAGASGFYRDDSRSAPNNVVFKMGEKIAEVNKEFPVKSPLSFSDAPTIQGEEAETIEIPYRDGYMPAYVWDAANNVYLRYYNGKPHADGATGEQLAFSNVIVQHVNYAYAEGKSNSAMVEMTGTNRCDYFIGGHHFTGYWKRDKASESTVYYDDNDNVVQFARGKTCVQLVKQSIEAEYGMLKSEGSLE